jgi:Bifunctional DNA primase/polymerase, N-terminal/AAA domain
VNENSTGEWPSEAIFVEARRLAELKIRTFPVGGNRKPLGPFGYNIASANTEKLKAWFRGTTARLALRPSDAQWVVFNVPASQVNSQIVRELPRTRTIRTPRGGLHLYYTTTKRLGHASFRGIKIISDKGYVLTPPNPGYTVADNIEPTELRSWIAEEIQAPWKRPRALRPSEGKKMSKITFWDEDHLLPHSPAGAIAVLGAKRGAHKTNLVLTWILDAIAKGAKVVYAAGEGYHGVMTQRLPAHATARGVELESLDDHLVIFDAVPLLTNADSVSEFISQVEDEMPEADIIVIDTLATATAGTDENGSQFSGVITDNGSAGKIKNVFKALVLILAHEGKVEGRGIRGHSGTEGNADAVLSLSCWPQSGGLELKAEKIKDGKDGFSTFYQVPPKGSDEVPVPRRISLDEFKALTAAEKARARKAKKAKAGEEEAEEDETAETPKTNEQLIKEAGISRAKFYRQRKAEREAQARAQGPETAETV